MDITGLCPIGRYPFYNTVVVIIVLTFYLFGLHSPVPFRNIYSSLLITSLALAHCWDLYDTLLPSSC